MGGSCHLLQWLESSIASIRSSHQGGECRGVAKIPIFLSVSGVIFTKGAMRNIFNLLTNGKKGTVKNGYFLPFFSHFGPI